MPKRNYTTSIKKHGAWMARKKRRLVRSSKRRPSTSSVKKICQKIIDKNTEFKRYVRDLAPTALNNITTGQILFQGPQLPQGSDALDRDGDEVMLRKLRFNILTKTTTKPNRVRFILVRYSQPPATLDLSTVLLNTTAQNVMLSPWIKNGDIRYQIVYNKIHRLGTMGVMDSEIKYQQFKIDVKFNKAGDKLHYNGPVTQNPDKNCYVLYAVCDLAFTPTTGLNEIQMYTEAVFTDM